MATKLEGRGDKALVAGPLKKNFFWSSKKNIWPLSSRGGDKALVSGRAYLRLPLVKKMRAYFSLELLNYYLTLVISNDRFSILFHPMYWWHR